MIFISCKWWFNFSPAQDAALKINAENMLEEKDPQYDAMLSQMVGRIQSKSGGKSEMGEVSLLKLMWHLLSSLLLSNNRVRIHRHMLFINYEFKIL